MITGPQLPVNLAPKVGRKRPIRFTGSYKKPDENVGKYGRYEQSSHTGFKLKLLILMVLY